MKILIQGMTKNRGGKETFIESYIKGVVNGNNHIDLLATDTKICDEAFLENLGVNIFYIPQRSENYIEYCRQMEKIIKDGDYDVLWLHMTTLSSIELLKLGKKHQVPCRIIHSHSSENTGTIFTNTLHHFHKKQIAKIATDFFACSKEASDWFYSGLPVATKIIKNGFNVDAFRYSDSTRKTVRNELSIDRKFVVGHVGRFVKVKNHERLLEIFCDFTKIREDAILLLVGTGEYGDIIKDKIEILGLKDRVICLGERDDVAALMQAFDCFVFPSFFEGLPYVLLEAQAAGLSCFVSDGISKEAGVTGLADYLSLNCDNGEWINKMNAVNPNQRHDYSNVLKDNGFDINSEILKIERIITMRLLEKKT